MKLAFGSLSSYKRSITSKFKRSASNKSRSVSRKQDPSLGSTSSSSSSSSSSLESPRTVLPLSVSDLFNVFDRDRDGKITKQELEAVLRQLSPGPLTDQDIISMVNEVDRDGDGCISLDELGAIGSEALVEVRGGSDELRDAFRVFDADGDGKISAEELMMVFLALGEGECAIDDCERMIRSVDSDGDGFVCFEDFVRMMMMDGARR